MMQLCLVSKIILKLGFTKAVIGLSGGIDSAVVLYLAAKALGAENVRILTHAFRVFFAAFG